MAELKPSWGVRRGSIKSTNGEAQDWSGINKRIIAL